MPYRVLTFVLPFLCATATAQVAPNTPFPAGQCDGELAGIRVALEKIAAALASQADSRAIDAAFRRIELSLQEFAPLQNEMRGLQNVIASTEAELVESGRRLTRLEEQAESGVPPEGQTLADLEAAAARMEDEIAGQRRRLAQLRPRVAELEALLAAAEAERGDWKRYLDQQIGRRSN